MTDLTAVSLFAGIGGFDLALQRSGVKVVAAVEIDPAARSVLARQFPDVKLFEDVREVTGDDLRAAGFVPERGIVTAGWPCQGNSVAGSRGGMTDPRSALWKEVERLLKELRPAWFLGENVPGLLSVNNGADMEEVLNDLNDLGYVVDPNIYDAQVFGVPQMRRRVILTCQRLDLSLQTRTTSSALTLAQCLIEISLLSLIVLSRGSAKGSAPWDSQENCVDGLRKRINLFGMQQPIESIFRTWLPVLTDDSVKQALAPSTWGSLLGEHTGGAPTPKAATSSLVLTAPQADTSLSTASSWRQLLTDLLPIAKWCITSTPSKPTTTPEIFTCAQALLSISEYIAALSYSSPNSWQPASSASTAIEVLTNYARSTDGDLLAELDGLHDLFDFVVPAERAHLALRRAGGAARRLGEVLPDPEGGTRDFASSSHPRQDTARAPGARAGDSRTTGRSRRGAHIVGSLTTSTVGGIGGPDDNTAQAGHLLVAYALTAREGKGADSDATTNLLPVDGVGVRRLTPLECERLQGYPDEWTGGQSDAARYRECGNSVAVPVVEWNARRIVAVDSRQAVTA